MAALFYLQECAHSPDFKTDSAAKYCFARNSDPEKSDCINCMKQQRHGSIRTLLETSTVTNQDDLRKKLAKLGFIVTQATLSRDIHELRIYKGPNGYALPSTVVEEDDEDPGIKETLENFGLKVRQAQNLLVVITTTGSAQPIAAALDYEDWPEVIGTIAGDDTVLVICKDSKEAGILKARMEGMIG
jgi:transcriptional regulator of arginine metabolism